METGAEILSVQTCNRYWHASMTQGDKVIVYLIVRGFFLQMTCCNADCKPYNKIKTSSDHWTLEPAAKPKQL